MPTFTIYRACELVYVEVETFEIEAPTQQEALAILTNFDETCEPTARSTSQVDMLSFGVGLTEEEANDNR